MLGEGVKGVNGFITRALAPGESPRRLLLCHHMYSCASPNTYAAMHSRIGVNDGCAIRPELYYMKCLHIAYQEGQRYYTDMSNSVEKEKTYVIRTHNVPDNDYNHNYQWCRCADYINK